MSQTPSEAETADQSADHHHPDVDHEAIPHSFVTTIRVERSTAETYRATQHDTDIEGYGSTPHLAIIDFARRAESSCFETGTVPDGTDRSPGDPGP